MPVRLVPLAVAALAVCAGRASGQCLPLVAGAPIALANADEALSAPLPLNLTFPMAGAVGGSFTHCVVSTNGVLYLTQGGAAAGAATFDWGGVASLRGAPGAAPRIAPFWSDLWDAVPGAWQVTIDTAIAGRCAVTWSDVAEWDQHQPAKSCTAELFADGVIRFTWSAGAIDRNPVTIGVSIGDAVPDPGATDLSIGATATGGLVYEILQPGAFDLAAQQITFTPNGLGYDVAATCVAASHAPVGAGCYALSDSAYEVFADAVVASAALTNESLVFTPNAVAYTAQWGGAAWLAAQAPVPLLLGDDDEFVYLLPQPLPSPFGQYGELTIHANGILGLGNQPFTFPGSTSAEPTVGAMLANAATAFYAWHDYDPSEPGSAPVTAEVLPVGGETVLCVAWDGVENRPSGVVNASRMQFQVNLTTGVVAIVWDHVDDDPSSAAGSAHLIGFSPGGPSQDAGATLFASASPLALGLANLAPLALTVAPTPISTPYSGTALTYTATAIPVFTSGTSMFVGVLALSLTAGSGVDLSTVGIDSPGCALHVGGLDLALPIIGTTAAQTIGFALPAGVAPGTPFFAQAFALVAPNSLPNGLPGSGFVASNGIASLVGSF